MKNRKNFKKKNFRREEDEVFGRKERRKKPKLPKKISKYGIYSILKEEDMLDNQFPEQEH